MSRNTILIVLVLGVGLGAGYFLGASQNPPVVGDRAVRAQDPRAHEDAPRNSAAPSSGRALSEVLNNTPARNFPRGTGRVSGFVRDSSGKGVAGVTIRGMPQFRGVAPRKGGAAPSAERLEDTVRKAVEDYHRRQQTTVDAITDRSGAYELGGLVDENYYLQAFLEGHTVQPAGNVRVWDVPAGSTIDWNASVVVAVAVDVLLPDGSRPRQARIMCQSGRHTHSEQWSPEHPEIFVAPGNFTFTVSKGGDDQYSSESIKRTIAVDAPRELLTFQLVGRSGIRGWVRFVKLDGFSHLVVHALRASGDKTPTPAQLRSNGKEAWIHSHNNFEFSFLDLPSGRYFVAVGVREGAILAQAMVDVGDQIVKTELVVDQIDPADFVVLNVLGPDGKPMVVDDLSTSYRTENSSSSGGGAWARRSDGTYLVFHHAHDRDDGGFYGIEATSGKYGKQKVEYRRGAENSLKIQFHESATLTVDVAEYVATEHVGRVHVGLREKTGDRGSSSVSATKVPDAEGRAVLGPVQTGKYEVVLSVALGRNQYVPAASQKANLAAGENSARMTMPTLHPLVVRGTKGQRISLRRETENGTPFRVSQRCDDGGKATFGPLPAGRYSLRVDGAGGEMKVTVPCGEVSFKPTEFDAVKVTVRSEDGWFAKAGFVDGDLIVGVDGTEFKDTTHMRILFSTAMAKADAVLTVVRGGRTLELTADFSEFMKTGRKNPGGRFQQSTR
jgi:hypothetical protein